MRASLKQKIFIERVKIVRDYGVCEIISDHIKNIIALILANILIWCSVVSLVPPPLKLHVSMVSSVSPSGYEEAADSVREAGESKTIAVKDSATEELVSTLAPQGQPVDDSFPSGIEQMIAKTFPEEPKVMIAIAHAESGFNRFARNVNRNGSVDRGIFQLNSIHGFDEEWLTVTENNLIAARKIYDKQGLQAWSAYNNGSYKKYL